jgi:EmrB/QacA subfamily drug resistance transporter
MSSTSAATATTGTSPQTSNPAAVLLVASGAIFLAFLDVTVVNVAFPQLHTSFHTVTVATLTWVVTGYAVPFAALLASAGRVADVLGRRRMMQVSVAGFTVASLLSAVAPSFGVLVAARALQGVFAAGMVPAALGLVLAETPPAKRGAAIGAWGAAGAFAATVGPALAGLVIAAGSWRYVFVLNIPIGLAMIAVTMRSVRRDVVVRRPLPDPVGTVLVALGLGALALGISEGESWHWTSGATLGLIAGGVLGIGLGLARSRRHPAPAVEIELWRNHRYAVANAASFLFGCAIYAWMLAGPLFVVSTWGYSVLKAGLAVTPGAVTSTIASLYLGKRATPTVQRWALVGGALLFGVVSIAMAYTITDTPRFLVMWLPAGLFGGAAIGFTLTALTTASATSVPPLQFAAGTALTLTARQVGGAFGVAAMAALLSASHKAGADHFMTVYIFCGLVAVAAMAVGILLRPPAPAPAA